MKSEQLTIFYDGLCPLCCAEMDKLKRNDTKNLINLVNLHSTEFEQYAQNIDKHAAMKILHGEYQGRILKGLNVTHRAWTLVGKGCLVAPLQWPVFKQVSHLGYLVVAKYRQPISSFSHKFFGIGSAHCEKGVCYGNTDNRRK